MAFILITGLLPEEIQQQPVIYLPITIQSPSRMQTDVTSLLLLLLLNLLCSQVMLLLQMFYVLVEPALPTLLLPEATVRILITGHPSVDLLQLLVISRQIPILLLLRMPMVAL